MGLQHAGGFEGSSKVAVRYVPYCNPPKLLHSTGRNAPENEVLKLRCDGCNAR